jgi:methionyl-tRNA formyltransferase
MRFAITATDRYLGVFDAFLAAGWEPIRLFTVPTDGRLFSNSIVVERARARKMDIQLSRLKARDLESLRDDGCDVLVVASYQWRILEWEKFVPHAVNFHPSLLPQFRGPYPLVNGLLARTRHWGATCHKLAPEYDSGDILAQRGFDVAPGETHETLDLRTQIAMSSLATEVALNFKTLWTGAKPQGAGTYAPLFDDSQRTIDFAQSVDQILNTVRAFGRFECLATVGGVRTHIARAEGWQEPHRFAPGQVVHRHELAMVVACSDGFIALLEWHILAPLTVTGTNRR